MDIILDFDGTVVTNEFPRIGEDIGAVPVLKELVECGHNLILFTMRSDMHEAHIKNPGTIKDQGAFRRHEVFRRKQLTGYLTIYRVNRIFYFRFAR